MLCQNCGKNEVTFRYTQVINGVKKEMNLCDKCARELGFKDINFNMPISFSSFLSDFFNEYNDNLLPSFIGTQAKECDNCGTTFDDFINDGEFGCSDCYDIFEDRISPILKSLQGANRHIGRDYKKLGTSADNEENISKNKIKKDNKKSKIEILQKDLQKAIKEERYEDAAKIRDEIKTIENTKASKTKKNENQDNNENKKEE